MRAAAVLLVALVVSAGCLGAPGVAPEPGERAPGAVAGPEAPDVPDAVRFLDRVLINGDGYGFEPGIEVGPDGTVYVSAHRTRAAGEGGRLSSLLWHSLDGGRTWREMPSPGGAHTRVHGVEGSLAVDGEGRVYFADTNLADSALTRWATTESGPRWEWTRPVQGTLGLDDRPWLAAHGDGVVYALGSNRAPAPAPGDAADGDAAGSDTWLYASTDGGVTWTLGKGFPGSQPFCGVAASPADDSTVVVACNHAGEGGLEAVAHVSRDRGETWRAHPLAPREHAPRLFHIATAVDRGGNAYVAWVDDDRGDDAPGALHVAKAAGAAHGGAPWRAESVTPFNGTIDEVWMAAGDAGTAVVNFYATADVPPGDDSEWHPYLLVTANGHASRPEWRLVRLGEGPAGVGRSAPMEFFQTAVGPENAVHVVYARDHGVVPITNLTDCCSQRRQDLFYTRQVAGPNLPR